jgi:hypothetical protein
MLIFTNREVDIDGAGNVTFSRQFQPGAMTLGSATAQRGAAGFETTDGHAELSDDDAMHMLVPLFGGQRPLLVYLHGNNNTPDTCFERCARLEEIYDVEVLGFSWPSEGYLSSGEDLPNMPAASGDDGAGDEASLARVSAKNRKEGWAERRIRRYRQAKVNAQDSVDALARFLRLMAAARLYANQQRMTVAAHSLGCHLLQYAIEVEAAAESLGAAQNIALLAACCRADGHAGWVSKLGPKGQVFITYNKGDSVLFGAFIADGQQIKLGTEPGARITGSPKVRYVSFTNAQVGFLGGHTYFVRAAGDKMPKAAKKVFGRIFSSERDIREDQGEYPRKVYPVGCDEDGTTCYMAAPDAEPDGQ